MSVTIDFVAKIAIGIRGIALLEINETLSKHSVDVSSGIGENLIIEDISDCGIEEWAQHALTDIPIDPGVYTFRGSVRLDEDDADYSVTCDEI